MLKISYAGSLGLSPAISSQFSVEMCAAFKNCEKFTKNPFLRVQGRSRSSMLINLKSLSPVLAMINGMFVPICNRFQTTRANNGKITSFGGYEILSRKTRDLEAAHSEDFVILGVAVLIQCQGVTDRRTDAQAMAKTREAFCYRAQKATCFLKTLCSIRLILQGLYDYVK